jgi:hypothetical protein
MKKVLLVLLLTLTTICHSQIMTKRDVVLDTQMSTFKIYTNWVKEMGDTAWIFTHYSVMMRNGKYQYITDYIHLSYNTKEELLKDFRLVKMDILADETIYGDKFYVGHIDMFGTKKTNTIFTDDGHYTLYKSTIDLIEKSLVDNPKPIDTRKKIKEKHKANKTARKILLGFAVFFTTLIIVSSN